MYAIGRRVYCRSQQRAGEIVEANYVGRPRRAHYVVRFGPGDDYLTGPSDLRPADWRCDGCGGWRTGPPAWSHPEAGDFCFICKVTDERSFERERAKAYARGEDF